MFQLCFAEKLQKCLLWNFSCLPISMRVSRKWMHFHFWVNLYSKEIVMSIFAIIRLFEIKRKWSFQSFYHCHRFVDTHCIFRVHLFTKISQDTLTLPTHEKITAVKKKRVHYAHLWWGQPLCSGSRFHCPDWGKTVLAVVWGPPSPQSIYTEQTGVCCHASMPSLCRHCPDSRPDSSPRGLWPEKPVQLFLCEYTVPPSDYQWGRHCPPQRSRLPPWCKEKRNTGAELVRRMSPQSGMEVNGQLKDAAAVTPQISAQTTVMSRQVTWEKIIQTHYDNMPVWECSIYLHLQGRVHIMDAD